eukprot:GILJ01004440.1.p1 GENE.GILJ01004440.1~~GILJ01004440.1.p1  ORF type:complete len:479 (+),score=47.07 GILJ01004440.1:3-1439(+)
MHSQTMAFGWPKWGRHGLGFKVLLGLLALLLVRRWLAPIEFEKPHLRVLARAKSYFVNQDDRRVTAVVLNWKRLHNMKSVIKNLLKYEFVGEVIVWNNNADIPLTTQMLQISSRVDDVRIVNSPQNLLFFARFLGCQIGRFSACLFQDDDWQMTSARALYYNFWTAPHLIHCRTNTIVHELSRRWSFYNRDIGVHTSFAWLGTGAIASQALVKSFIVQMSSVGFDAFSWGMADLYFTTWTNQVPYQLEDHLIELNQENSFTGTPGEARLRAGVQRNKQYMEKGARILYEQIALKNPLFVAPVLLPSLTERNSRSACLSDDCIFLTDMDSLQDMRYINYHPGVSIDDLEAGNVIPADVLSIYFHHPYHHAVDNDKLTSYRPPKAVARGSYFGLDLFEVADFSSVTVTGVLDVKQYSLQTSIDGSNWFPVDVKWTSSSTTVTFSPPANLWASFRYVRLLCMYTSCGDLTVYDISYQRHEL